MTRPRRPPRPALRAIASLVLLALSAVPLAAAEPPKVERLPIVDRAIEHHGGDLYRGSDSELDVCSRSGCFHVRARVDGDLYRYEVTGTVRGADRRVVATNDSVEMWEDGEPVELDAEGQERARDFVNARIYFPYLPYRLNDPSVYKQDLGLESWNGRELHKVKVTFAAGSSTDADDEYLYWLDPDTGRVEQLAYSFQGNPGGLRFRTGKNYRRVGGILFFDQSNLGIEGDGLRVDQIDPDFVRNNLRPVSEVRFDGIAVRPLEASETGGLPAAGRRGVLR